MNESNSCLPSRPGAAEDEEVRQMVAAMSSMLFDHTCLGLQPRPCMIVGRQARILQFRVQYELRKEKGSCHRALDGEAHSVVFNELLKIVVERPMPAQAME